MQLLPDRYYAAVEQRHSRRAKNIRLPAKINQKKEKEKRQKIMAKKEIDGVVVEAKSILTALRIIRTVCEDNEQCENCPLGMIGPDVK